MSNIKVLTEIVRKWGNTIQYIENPTENMCNISVIQNGTNLQYIKEEYQTPTVCLNAVRQNGSALTYIKNRKMIDKQFLKTAFTANGEAILSIIFPEERELIDEELFCLAIENMQKNYNPYQVIQFYKEKYYPVCIPPNLSPYVQNQIKIQTRDKKIVI